MTAKTEVTKQTVVSAEFISYGDYYEWNFTTQANSQVLNYVEEDRKFMVCLILYSIPSLNLLSAGSQVPRSNKGNSSSPSEAFEAREKISQTAVSL